MKSRRDFLRTASAVAAGGLVLPFGCSPKKSGEAASAGIEAATEGINKNVGIQLYTVRNEIDKMGIEAVLEKVAGIGYKWMEPYGYEGRKLLGNTPAEFKTILKNNGLTAPSVHSVTEVSSAGGKDAIIDQMKTTAEDALAIGAKYLVWAFLQPADRETLDQYKAHIDTWNQFGEICKDAGIQFAYHNHDFEFMTLEGQIPYDMIMANTDADNVKFELDLYWITKADKDPVAYFKKAPGRFELWHVKDMEDSEERFFAEVGQGTIDFKRIFAERNTAGMKYFFVEQDDGRRPDRFESIDMSIKFLNNAEYV